MRLCRAGADKVSLELEHEFQALSGLVTDEGYGMTEVGLATLNPRRGRSSKVDRPARRWLCDSCDEERCERQRHRRPGLDPHPESDHRVLGESGSDRSDPARRLARLGDLARADDDGYLWFFGRKKQIIVHDGSNISPGEVEEALAEHPVTLWAWSASTTRRTVRTCAPTSPSRTAPSVRRVTSSIESARGIGYKAPEEVVFLDEMPVNPTGKLDRVVLKALAEDHLHPHGLPA